MVRVFTGLVIRRKSTGARCKSLECGGRRCAGAGDNAPYRPTLKVAARLVSRDGKQNYFTDVVAYNNVQNQAKVITLEPEPRRFAYADFDELEAAGLDTVEGIKLAIDRTSDALVQQL